MRSLYPLLITITLLAGCNSTPKDNTSSQKIATLEQALSSAKTENENLNNKIKKLDIKIDELNGLVGVLDTEKSSRTSESSNVRGKVRHFIQQQIASLKDFLVDGGLLDYVGGELVERSTLGDEPLTLVDIGNKITKSGIITGIGAYTAQPTSVKVKVLRQMEKKLIVIWQSDIVNLNKTGLNKHQFTNAVSVEAGDVIAYEFSNKVGVAYTTGTGNTHYSNTPLQLGQVIKVSSLKGSRSKRAYSIGVYGLLGH